MAAYRLEIAYDGTRFAGWAVQPGLRTVQGELEDALAKVLGARTTLTVAGRTDAGVHALAQVAGFVTAEPVPPELQRALNALTGRDLAIDGLSRVADGFDARRDARSRRYRYRVEAGAVPSPFERRRALHWPYRLDLGLAERSAEALRGTHDFTAFTPTDSEHRQFQRTVLDASWTRESERIVAFEIEADSFMRSMVRVVVGTVLEVATGRREPADFDRLLGGATRAEAGVTAPPQGLYLVSVTY